MNWRTYYEARGYAWKLSPANYLDIVHDAYLVWYDKTGRNLFSEHRGVVSQTIKNVAMNEFGTRRLMWRGEYYPKVFVEPGNLQSGSNPEKIYIKEEEQRFRDDLITRIAESLTPLRAKIFELVREGHSQTDIGKKLGLTHQAIHYHINQIIQYNAMWINPFAGSKLKVTKTLTNGQWEKRTDKDDFIREDYNEFYELWQHSESREGLLVRLPPQKTNPYIK